MIGKLLSMTTTFFKDRLLFCTFYTTSISVQQSDIMYMRENEKKKTQKNKAGDRQKKWLYKAESSGL